MAARRTGYKRVRWSRRMREEFLDALAGSCNIKASAAAVGVEPESVYYLKRNDARFAEEWSKALACGYEVLETRLVGLALAGEGRTVDNGVEGPIDKELALKLLGTHRDAMLRKPRAGGPPIRRATSEETDAAILARIEKIERARKAGAA